MIHKLSAGAIVCALFAISMTAYAQGRPAGAGSQGGGGRPSMSQQQSRGASMRQDSELRRQQSEARRQAAEEKRLAAEADAAAKRAAGEAHNMSGDTPSGRQAPNEHAAQEAFDAELNADNATEGGSPRNAQGVAQRDTRGGDGEEADAD